MLTIGIVAAVLLSGWLFPDGGEAMNLAARLTRPFQSIAHVFGTDPLGRDVLARVVVGGKISLTVGFLSVLGGALLGTAMGVVAGWYRGFWDVIVMRFADVQLALPFILVAMTFISILGGGITNIGAVHDCVAMGAVRTARCAHKCWPCASVSSCRPHARSACAIWR